MIDKLNLFWTVSIRSLFSIDLHISGLARPPAGDGLLDPRHGAAGHPDGQHDGHDQDDVGGDQGGGVHGAGVTAVQQRQAGDKHVGDAHECCLPVGS